MSLEEVPGDVSLADQEATERLGGLLAAVLRPRDVLLLEGPLGAGKTTLVRGLVAALGGDEAEVCSPTFVLLESYPVSASPILRVHHADLYRLRGMERAPWDEVGLGEVLDDPAAITAVEWPEGLGPQGVEGCRVLVVRLSYEGEGRRATMEWLGLESHDSVQ